MVAVDVRCFVTSLVRLKLMHSGRMVRLLPAGRKNVYMYLDKELVDVDHLCFIETYKMCGVSTLEYFKEFFKAIMQGRTDYENMLPMTIGIKK